MPETTLIVESRRKELKLTQKKMAKRLGVTRQYYNEVERFKSTPSVKLAKEIAIILSVDWTIFFNREVNS